MQDVDLRRFGIYTMKQAAEFLGCNRATIYRKIKAQLVPEPAKYGSMSVYTKRQLDKMKGSNE